MRRSAFTTGRTGRLFIEFALDARRRGAGFGLRRADAVADDVLEAAAHQAKHGLLYRIDRARASGDLTNGYRARCLRRARRTRRPWSSLADADRRPAPASCPVHAAEVASWRRSRIAACMFGHRSSRREGVDPRIHRPLCQARIEADVSRRSRRSTAYFVVSGNPEVSQATPSCGCRTWDERERKQQDDRRRAAAANVQRDPRRHRLPDQSAVAGPELRSTSRSSSSSRPRSPMRSCSGSSTRCWTRSRKYPGLVRRRHRPQAQQAASSTSTSTATRPPTSASASTRSAARSRPCSAAARSRASSANGEQYDVIVQVGRRRPHDARRHQRHLRAQRRDGAMVPLVEPDRGRREAWRRKELNHFNQLRAGHDHGARSRRATRWARRWTSWTTRRKRVLPAPAQTDYARPVARVPRVGRAASIVTFVLALCFIYLVLAAQFESFIDPFIIMLTVPLSMTGALLALWLDRRHAQHLQPDRPGHAGRADHQARHPDRRVRQPAARARAAACSRR